MHHYSVGHMFKLCNKSLAIYMFTFQTTSYSPFGDNLQCHACLVNDNVLLHKDIKMIISLVGNHRILHLH
jgi:hypothetical protein